MKCNIDLLKLFDSLSEKNLQINPFYIKISGSIVGGYFLTQLIYLFKISFKYKEFFKPDEYFHERLLLSEWELRSQKKKLCELGLIKIRHGKGKITWYTVNIQRIIDLAIEQGSVSDSRNEDSSDLETRIPRIRNEDSSDLIYNTTRTHKENYKPPIPPDRGNACAQETLSDVFERLWAVYPHKKGKDKARQSFLRIMKGKKLSEVEILVKDMTEGLLRHIEEHTHHVQIKTLHPDWDVFYPDWPHGGTWINQKRWQDNYETNGDVIYEKLKQRNSNKNSKSVDRLFR